jgi:hypothetical protein
MAEGVVSSQRFAAEASLIEADANKQNSTPKEDRDHGTVDPSQAPRAVTEYLGVLDDAAFGAASKVEQMFTPHSDPASQWTAARKGSAFFAYSANYLIDTDHAVIVPSHRLQANDCRAMDVEATRSIRQAEVGSVRTMLGWLVDRGIAPHIPVIDKASRTDGTWTLNGTPRATNTSAQKVSLSSNLVATTPIPFEAQPRQAGSNIVGLN